MDFEHLAGARDLFYAALGFVGLSFGCFGGLISPREREKRWNRSITLGLCLFAGAIGCFGGALIKSRGTLVFIEPLLIPGGIIGLLGLLAVCFPRAAAFPLVLLAGLVTVWLGYSFLRFPTLGSGEQAVARVSCEGRGTYRIALSGYDRSGNPRGAVLGSTPPDGSASVLLRVENQDTEIALDVSLGTCSFDPRYPLVGGLRKGAVTKLRHGEGVFFSNFSPGSPFLRDKPGALGMGIYALGYEIQVPLQDLTPGASRLIFLDGSTLSVPPPG